MHVFIVLVRGRVMSMVTVLMKAFWGGFWWWLGYRLVCTTPWALCCCAEDQSDPTKNKTKLLLLSFRRWQEQKAETILRAGPWTELFLKKICFDTDPSAWVYYVYERWRWTDYRALWLIRHSTLAQAGRLEGKSQTLSLGSGCVTWPHEQGVVQVL